MKALYCHDNYYCLGKDEKVWSQGQFSYEYWSTFLDSFDKLTVAGRGRHLTPEEDYSRYNLSSGPGVSFELMPNMNTPSGMLTYRSRISKELEKLVSQADAVIIRACSDIGWIAYRHARRMKKPLAIEMAACAWDSTWYHGSILGKIYAPVRYLHDRVITANADAAIYVSRDFLQKRYPASGRVAVASNVRINRPEQKVLGDRLEKINEGNGERPFVIGLIGTISHKLKGVHTALDALEILSGKTDCPEFVFWVLGPGNPRMYKEHALRNGLQDKVDFDGIIESGENVFKWLDNVDIYIQPSFQEGVPRALIEAMSRGCPAIGSTTGGIPELLGSEWLHAPGDARRLAELLEKMLADNELREKAARKNFAKSFEYTSDKLLPVRRKFWRDFVSLTDRKMTSGGRDGMIAVSTLSTG